MSEVDPEVLQRLHAAVSTPEGFARWEQAVTSCLRSPREGHAQPVRDTTSTGTVQEPNDTP